MGGRALKNTETRRYQRDEFEVVSKELMDILSKDFNQVTMPLFYNKKESFGDADIILDITDFPYDMREYIIGTFDPNEIFHNGNCWSFDYKELQVDLITTNELDYDTNYHYLAFNDLGNFIGRIAHGLGLKYGQEGLWYEYYFKGQNIGRIEVSRDYRKIFEFLHLSYDRWLEGFDTLEDIFEYICQSDYFNYEMFQLKTLNKINRERNIKRVSYMSFLEYIEKYKDVVYVFPDKSETLKEIIKIFPESNIEMEICKLDYEFTKKKYINSKFNGGEVMRRFGLQGKELGDAMFGFKKFIKDMSDDKSGYDNFILDRGIEEIYAFFSLFHKKLVSFANNKVVVNVKDIANEKPE